MPEKIEDREKWQDYRNKYKQAHYKRIALEVKKDDFPKIEKAAADAGLSVNGFIKKCIMDQLEPEPEPEK